MKLGKFARHLILITLYFILLAPAALAQPELGLGPYIEEETGLKYVPPQVVIARIISIALGFLGIVAVIIVLMGGFSWMTARGNEEKVGNAKKLLVAGIIGLVIILSAYVIARFVVEELIRATTLQ